MNKNCFLINKKTKLYTYPSNKISVLNLVNRNKQLKKQIRIKTSQFSYGGRSLKKVRSFDQGDGGFNRREVHVKNTLILKSTMVTIY